LGRIIIGSSTQMRVGGRVVPRESCRRHSMTKLQCEGPWRTRSGAFIGGPGAQQGRPRGIPVNDRKEWRPGTQRPGASKPADLEGHQLGETKAAPEELLRTVQEPEEEAGQPQPWGASSKASRELVRQGDEREGSPGGCRRAQRQVDLSLRAGAAVSKKRRLPSGSK
jgi:hypothetical protein